MPRRTIYLPDDIEMLVHLNREPGESFSATVARLIVDASPRLDDDDDSAFEWIGSFDGPGDLSINAEKYLGLKPWGPGEKPGDLPFKPKPRESGDLEESDDEGNRR